MRMKQNPDNAPVGAESLGEAPENRPGLLLPLLSSVVFGAIGAKIGHSLGKRGDSTARQLATRVLTWGTGGMFSVIAFYSARQAPEPASMHEAPVWPKKKIANPHHHVSAEGAEHLGMVEENHQKQRA
jgi:hypothetical protein